MPLCMSSLSSFMKIIRDGSCPCFGFLLFLTVCSLDSNNNLAFSFLPSSSSIIDSSNCCFYKHSRKRAIKQQTTTTWSHYFYEKDPSLSSQRWKSGSSSSSRIILSSMSDNDDMVDNFGRDPKWQERSQRWVVLVDDEIQIRKSVGQFLFDSGYQVTACADANTALQVARSNRRPADDEQQGQQSQIKITLPDIIVSDIRMPDMDGLELLQEIRSDPQLMALPVVLLTAKGDVSDRIAGYDAGADAYVPKPFDPDELLVIIDSVTERYQSFNRLNDDDNGSGQIYDDLRRDVDEIKYLLMERGGGGVGYNGWVESSTNVFLAQDERMVLEYLCQGLMNKEIASKTYLSTRRIEQLLTSMYRKTEVKNRTELVRWAIATGNVQI